MKHLKDADFMSIIDGAFHPDQEAGIRGHLASCDSCQAQFRQLEARARFTDERLSYLEPIGTEQPREPRVARERFNKFTLRKETRPMWYQIFGRRSRAFQVSAVLIMLLLISLAFPPVRAIANSFLGLFRVQQIAVVEINPANLPEQLGSSATFEQLLVDSLVYQEPASPKQVGSAEEAARAAGIQLRLPTNVDEPAHYWVQSGSQAEFRIDVDQLELLMKELGLRDVDLPAGIDGETASLMIPSSVAVGYGECEIAEDVNDMQDERRARQDNCTMLVQIPSPTIEAPPELDLPRMGSAFLQLMGMTAEEADEFSRTIDWTTTLVIPIPHARVDHETVQVDGVEGTLFSQITQRHGPNYMLLWVRDGIVYALSGPGDAKAGLLLANSLQ